MYSLLYPIHLNSTKILLRTDIFLLVANSGCWDASQSHKPRNHHGDKTSATVVLFHFLLPMRFHSFKKLKNSLATGGRAFSSYYLSFSLSLSLSPSLSLTIIYLSLLHLSFCYVYLYLLSSLSIFISLVPFFLCFIFLSHWGYIFYQLTPFSFLSHLIVTFLALLSFYPFCPSLLISLFILFVFLLLSFLSSIQHFQLIPFVCLFFFWILQKIRLRMKQLPVQSLSVAAVSTKKTN